MITERQEKILHTLIKEYIDSASPISSELLKKRCGLAVSPATIRNDLQELTELGYIIQPHTSAGRVPTNKGYKLFIEVTFNQEDPLPQFISKEMELAKKKIDTELELAKQLIHSLTHISSTLHYSRLEQKDSVLEILEILGPSKTTYDKNIDLMKELLRELENF